ncbi:MAG: hypothetical protein EOP00_04340 [Pedobacter sp.]|nr:MAG: hypothetical protein EOP00_04340 [Pedobacter sp.]
MKLKLYFLTLIFGFCIGCNSSAPNEEKSKLETYTSKEVGWTIEIPEGYKQLSKTRMEANEKKGKDAIGKVTDEEVNTDKLIHLVNFQKNQFNSLIATAEIYDTKQNGDLLASNQPVKKMIYDTYTNQKIKVDTLSGTEVIAGYKFYTFNIKLYGPSGQVLMDQIMYNQIINGYDFGVTVNYNNETDRGILMNAFKNSKFIK